MSNNRGIFDSFPNPPATPAGKSQDSPFAIAPEESEKPAAAQADSPFTVVDEAAEAKAAEAGKAVKLPEARKSDSPFQVADAPEGFGFEAPPAPAAKSPFETAPAPATPPASPFSAAPESTPPASPFSTEAAPASSSPAQAAIAAFTDWQDPKKEAPSVPQAFAPSEPAKAEPKPAATPEPAPAPAIPVPAAFAPAPVEEPKKPAPAAPEKPAAEAPKAAAPAPAPSDESTSDSFSIRQLELRAIFGVDREMNTEEILQRSRALPGMRNIARVSPDDMSTIESLKTLLPNLGFGSGTLKLYSGSVPLEFIRENSVMLAVQTDGGFAPGVRETLMIVARELGRLG